MTDSLPSNPNSWQRASILAIADAIGNCHPCYPDLCSWADEIERLQLAVDTKLYSRRKLESDNERLRAAIQKAVAAMELEGLWGACLEGLKSALSDERGSAVETSK